MRTRKTIRNKLFFYALAILFCLISNTYAWDNNKFLDNSFWNTDPSTGEIISALYGTDSIYTSNRTGYDSTSCENMQVKYVTTLPKTLSGNTIYVLYSDISITDQIDFSKCSAIIGSGNITINTSVSLPNKYTFHIGTEFGIIDNLNIIGNNIYFYGVYGSGNNKTLNNLHLSGSHAGILFERSSYNYINNVDIYSDGGNLNSRCDSNCDFDGLSFYDNCKHNKIENINSFGNCYGVLLYDNCSNNKLNNIKGYNNNYYGLGLYSNCNYNEIENINSFGNKYGVFLYNNSSNNKLNNIELYNNSSYGLRLYTECNYNKIENISSFGNAYGILLQQNSSNNKINNIESYDNYYYGLGLYTNCNSNIINNVISYNNNENGIGIYNNSNYNSFNNIQSFNNGKSSPYAGFLIDASDNNIINNSVFYNNTKGIGNRDDRPGKNNIFINVSVYNNKLFGSSISGNNNKYYGILKSFSNGGNNEFTVLEKGNSTGILPEGQLTGGELSRDLITNPKNESKYILDWSKSLSGNRGVNEKFNAISYSFGTKIPTQSELYIWDGDEIITIGTANDNYIGSNTKKIEGKFLTNGINIVGTTTSENINKRIYLNTPGISGDINTYQGLDDNLTKSRTKSNTKSINPGNTEPMIGQFVIKGGNYMHTIAEEDIIAPTCNIKYSTTNTTSSNIIASLSDCSEYITGTELSHTFTTNGKYTFTFYDAIGNTGTTEAEVTWIYKATNGGGGGGGSYTQKPEETGNDTKNDEEEKKDNEFLFNKETFDPQYSDEINMGYQRSYASSITTKKTIKESETDQPLTRIAMAKMLSQYAINVLGEKPDTTRIINFYDISSELDANYNSGVTLAYQLGIMGINMPNNNFRPFDFVTRAEFGTALSRLLFNINDGIDFYYSPHLHKLAMEGIISNTNPDLQELRGYVMLMLMRSYLGIDKIENDNIVETKYNEESSQQINKYFTEPYRKGQIYKKIGDLQDLLRYLGFYKGKSNSVYNKATINAVYNFQIAMGLIDINDINNPAKGYLGPATRKALNEKRVEFQLNNK